MAVRTPILFSVLIALAWAAPQQAAGPRIAPGPLEIRARSADGKPVPGAVIRLGGRCAGTAIDGALVLDGVPAGRYPLVVEHLDFERHERVVELSPGKRNAVEVTLTPAAPVSFSGKVLLEDGGQPVPGAKIAFIPASVATPVRGRFDFNSDWDGAFRLFETPPGRYRAEVRVPGCGPVDSEIEVKRDMPEVIFRVRREASPASLKVVAQDAVSGRGMANAKVILAEAGSSGRIAEGTTDAAGECSFRDLRVGRLNWADSSGVVAVSRRQVTVRVEAKGYEPTLALTSLDVNAAITIPVPPQTKIEEQEPNNALEQAQAIRTGAPVELKIATQGDQDFFKFRLRHPAILKIALGPAGLLETYLRLLGGDGKVVHERGAGVGEENRSELGVPAGEYILHVQEWGNNGVSEKPMILRVDCVTAPDPLEPNDTLLAGRLFQSGEEARGCILPRGNADYYRFEMKRDGMARFRTPAHPLERYLRILDEGGRVQAESGAGATVPCDLQARLSAGRYVLELTEWGNNAESPEPYALRFDAAEDEGIIDPPAQPGRRSAARTLDPSGLVGSTINPFGDVDLFAVSIPSSGLLNVRFVGPIELYVRVLDVTGRCVAECGAGTQTPAAFAWSAPGPTVAYLEVTEWGNNNWSGSPYTLRTWFEPCDELEFMGRNESPETATPFEPGEPLRGSICPYGDTDVYRLDLDHAGYLYLEGIGPTELYVRVLDRTGKCVAEVGGGFNAKFALGVDMPAGACFLQVTEWGHNGSHAGAYEIKTRLDRGDPEERAPVRDDPVRPLKLGEARSFTVDQFGDRDRFGAAVAQAGKYVVCLRTAVETYMRIFDDQTGQQVGEVGYGPNQYQKIPLEAKGPTRYRFELTGWGENDRSHEPGFILLDAEGRDLVGDLIGVAIEPTDPTQVTFTRQAMAGVAAAAKVSMDADGDGRFDLEIPPGGVSWRYGTEGIYPALALFEGTNAQRTVSRVWVEAVGPRERKGVHVIVDHPAEGQTIERDQPVRARAISYTGARIGSVSLAIDDRDAGAVYSPPFHLDVPWRTFGRGKHVLAVTATDTRGERTTVRRTVELSEYFDLQPEDGAVVSGNDVKVRWTGEFGPARVRYRAKGETEWKEAVGENARERVVTLSGLETGAPYEFQPVGAGEPGPVRSFTRVKGLAFGRSRYGANIKRDYDQRVGISVRNHSDKPMTVRLECGKAEDPTLLIGFVGDGSEGAPFSLSPGEEREFLLGISAQDVKKEVHRFPVRIASDSGYSDEAEVELHVKLPVVKLEWEDLGATPSGLGRRFRLHNRGDALTDLDLATSNPDVSISPETRHGLLPAGSALEVTAHPKLHEGFTGAEAKLSAAALDKSVEQDMKVALKEGQRLYNVPLNAGEDSDLLRARAMAGAYLNPGYVDWSKRERPEDTNGDGRPDRWSVDDRAEGILWSGDDSDGDGEIDMVHADIGSDGQYDYSAFKTKEGYQETNLVEAWLEMGFKLPWDRKQYEKHDVDLVMNGQVVGQLRDSIPEGNYSFRLPPKAFRFNASGAVEASEIEIQSKHLRGGHYVVGSDFHIKTRLTGTRVWTAAASEEEAVRAARSAEGLVMEGADYSVSSGEVKLEGPAQLQKGADTVITVPVRNVGATRTRNVPVALMRAEPGGRATELTRVYVEELPLTGETIVRIPWKVSAGNHQLKVVVDPDRETGDAEAANNEAILNVAVPGDDAKPAVKLLNLEEGETLKDTIFEVRAEATDDAGISRVETQIDNGLWEALEGEGEYVGKGLLQPGEHQVKVRAIDSSGNAVEQVRHVKVEAETPEVEVEEPAAGSRVDTRTAPFRVKVAPDAKLAAMRVNGGPWHRVPIQNGAVVQNVPLPYGQAEVETMAANDRGAIRRVKQPLLCGLQPVEPIDLEGLWKNELPPDWDDTCVLPIEGLDEVDLAGPPNTVNPKPKTAAPKAQPAPQPQPQAEPAAAEPEPPLMAPPPPKPAGGMVALKQARSDWYCTNRPNIKVPFQLPEWVMGIKLPKPGTKEYEEMERRLLEQLRKMGIDTAAFERFQKYLLQKARTLEGPGQLPGFLESIGLAGPPPTDEEGLKRWREAMEAATHAWWLRLLSTGDPQLILDGLKARGEAFSKFDQGLQESAQAVIDTIHAWQKLTEDAISAIPAIGDGFDLIAIATGETLSGEKVTAMTIAMHALARLIPMGVGKILEKPGVKQALEGFVEKMSVMGREGLEALARKLGQDPNKLKDMMDKVAYELVKERSILGRGIKEQTDNAGKNFIKSAAGKADREIMEADLRAGQKAVRELKDALDGGDPARIKRAVADWQSDKTAQSILLNGRHLPDNLPKKDLERVWKETNDRIKKIYDDVDDDVRKVLKQDPEVIAAARRAGIDPATMDVDKMTITNVRPGSRSTPKPGRDRDVTYQIVGKNKDGRTVRVDVDDKVSKGVYEENFYQRTKGGLPTKADGTVDRAAVAGSKELGDAVGHHAEKLDQTVTSRWHAEAYNPGEVKLNDFLNKGITPTITRPDDVRDTIIYKGHHWFGRAKEAGNPAQYSKDVAEGMRQTTKQWKDLVMSRVQQYQGAGVAGNLRVPPHLQRGMEIFEQVEKGQVTPRQAEAMLQAMGATKESMVDGVGNFFTAMEKGTGDAFRKVKGAELAQNLSQMGNRGSTAYGDAAIEKINAALAGGRITGEKFLQLRNQVKGEVLAAAATPAAKDAAATWAQDAARRGLINDGELGEMMRAMGK